MTATWDDVQKFRNTTKYFLKVHSESEVNAAINSVISEIQGFSFNKADIVLNISFHVEPSLLYIYPCKEGSLFAEIDVKFTVQLCFLMESFEKIESKYYRYDEFYENEHKRLLDLFWGYTYPLIGDEISDPKLKTMYTDYQWSDEEGLELVIIRIKGNQRGAALPLSR